MNAQPSQPTSGPVAQREPLFVLGCPRSGTTLLAELLAASPWGKPTETNFIVRVARNLDRHGSLEQPAGRLALARDILRDRAVQQWKLDLDAQTLADSVPEPTYRSFVDTVMMRRSAGRGYAAWGDKTPHYLLHLDVLERHFPDARYVFIVRDGRDVALSLLGRRWGPNNVYTCARFWRDCHEEFPQLARWRDGGRLHELRYEDLLAAPAEHLAPIYRFLGVDVSDAELAELTGSIRSKNKYKWPDRMTSNQIDRFDAVAGAALARFGYEVRPNASLGPLAPLRWQLHDRAARAVELFRSNVIDGLRIRFLGKEPFAE